MEALTPIPVDFIREKVNLSWREAVWGLDRKWLGWRSLVDLARAQSERNHRSELIAELATVDKDRSHRASELARQLAATEPAVDEAYLKRKWLYLVTARLAQTKEEQTEFWKVIEEIYAEFDYPQEMRSFVPYEPPDGNDTGHYQTPYARLESNLQKYLSQAGAEFRS